MQRIFDPSVGNATLVASATEDFTHILAQYEQDQLERENHIRERDMRALGFGSRSSVCG